MISRSKSKEIQNKVGRYISRALRLWSAYYKVRTFSHLVNDIRILVPTFVSDSRVYEPLSFHSYQAFTTILQRRSTGMMETERVKKENYKRPLPYRKKRLIRG